MMIALKWDDLRRLVVDQFLEKDGVTVILDMEGQGVRLSKVEGPMGLLGESCTVSYDGDDVYLTSYRRNADDGVCRLGRIDPEAWRKAGEEDKPGGD